MRRTVSALFSLLLIISFATFAYSAEKVKIKQLTGEVAAVDAAAKSLTIKGKQAEMVFTIDDKTIVKFDKEKKSFSEIKISDKVTVKYAEIDGKKIAKNITIKPSVTDKKAKNSEPAKPAEPAKKK